MQKNDCLLMLKHIWTSLEESGNNNSGWKLLKVGTFPAGVLLAGRYYPDNMESVVFAFPEFDFSAFGTLPEGNGFEVRLHINKSMFPGTGLVINRKPNGNQELFSKTVEDVLGLFISRTSGNSIKNIKLILERIKAWQKFMQYNMNSKLTMEQEIGLWGELEFIQKTINYGLPASTVISAWKGPLDELHDFVFNGKHVEIKTSASINGFSINIGNLEQLMPPEDVYLYLQTFLLQKDSGKTLNEQVDSVKEVLKSDSDSLSHFESVLLHSGYTVSDADKYMTRYRILSDRLFLVDDNFPCIHRKNVSTAIHSARYSLDVNRIDVAGLELNDFCEGVNNGVE